MGWMNCLQLSSFSMTLRIIFKASRFPALISFPKTHGFLDILKIPDFLRRKREIEIYFRLSDCFLSIPVISRFLFLYYNFHKCQLKDYRSRLAAKRSWSASEGARERPRVLKTKEAARLGNEIEEVGEHLPWDRRNFVVFGSQILTRDLFEYPSLCKACRRCCI